MWYHIRIRREVPSCRSAWRPVPAEQVAGANSLWRMQSKETLKSNFTRGLQLGLEGHLQFPCKTIYKGKAKRGRVWRGEEKRVGEKQEAKNGTCNGLFQVQTPAGKAKDLSRVSGAWWRKWRERMCKYAVWRNWCASHPSKGCFREWPSPSGWGDLCGNYAMFLAEKMLSWMH